MVDNEVIRCMQLPLWNMQLLVPNSTVAEIIGYDRSQDSSAQGWYEGTIPWRGVMVPVLSVERMCEQASAEPGARTRIAVIYNPQGDEDLPYLGIILQDIPRAYLAEQEGLSGVINRLECDYLDCQVDEFNDRLVIPDIDAMVKAVRQQISA